MTENMQSRKDFLAAVKKGLENNPKRLPLAMIVHKAFIENENFQSDEGVKAVERTMQKIVRYAPGRLKGYMFNLNKVLDQKPAIVRRAESVRLTPFPNKLPKNMINREEYGIKFQAKGCRTG